MSRGPEQRESPVDVRREWDPRMRNWFETNPEELAREEDLEVIDTGGRLRDEQRNLSGISRTRATRTMFAACLESLGMTLCFSGSLLVMIACGLPTWKVNAFVEGNIVVAQSVWDGLWMSCVVQSTGHMQCKIHDSVLALSKDLQMARALTVISAVLGVMGLAVTVAGAQCTNCIKDETVKKRVVYLGGIIYILSGFFVLVPISWIANNIIVEFYDSSVSPAQKKEIGASIYIGWAATALLLCGGTLLCCSYSNAARGSFPLKLAPTKTLAVSGEFDKKHYV